MKRFLFSTIVSVISLFSFAQFKLTPSAGLITEDGPYTILRDGTESENYEVAMKAVEAAISDAQIGELEYEKSFAVTARYKTRGKLPGAMAATDWTIDYDLKVEVAENKILIYFTKIGSLVAKKRERLILTIHPTIGNNSMLRDILGNHHLFNSKGEICKGGKKFVAIYEDVANGIVKEIENNIK